MRSLAAPLIAAFPLLLAALAIASPLLGLGDWRDEVAARGLVSLGSWGAEPEDFRVLVCTGDPEYQAALRDGVLEVRIANGGGPATLWIAIAAANPGALPVTVEGVRVEASRGVSYEAYLYGPLQGLEGSPEWGATCRDLPLEGSVERVRLENGEEAVAWVRVEVGSDTEMAVVRATLVDSPG